MASIKFPTAVEMDGGETWTVIADQRDLAKYEVQPFYDPDRRMTSVRFIAWAASFRQGLTTLGWDAFDEACVEAGDPPGAEEPSVDPGRPERSDAPSSI